MTHNNYGRNRQSMADLEDRVISVFHAHDKCFMNDQGEPTLPADALLDCFDKFTTDGSPLLSETELEMFNKLLDSHPDLGVTPNLLLGFLAQRTQTSPPVTPEKDEFQLPAQSDQRGYDDDSESPYEPQDQDLQLDDLDMTINHRRSPSTSSEGPYSRPPSRGPPQTPTSSKSVFDTERRQRSTPLNAPSAWATKRPAPAARRKSDAGNRSDNEYGVAPAPFRRSTSGQGRTSRGPSNPTSPVSSSMDLSSFSPVSSPGPHSRPASRQGFGSQGFASLHFGSDDHGYSSSEDMNGPFHNSRRRSIPPEEAFRGSLNSIPLPRPANDDSDSDEEESVLGLVTERDIRESNASLADYERLEALQKQNTELQKKRNDAEEMLHRKVAEHEAEYAELEAALEQVRNELSATKREEKELRSKERQNQSQITALEVEVVKITKQLEHARSTYASLQKQYQEQCAHSEKYRQDLREREEKIRALKEAVSLHEIDREKNEATRLLQEERITQLELELENAQNAYAQLEEQKQENLLLKETIDRMRYDMDELRNTMATTTVQGGVRGTGSARNTLSKSLGAELAGKMEWDMAAEEEEEEEVSEDLLEQGDDPAEEIVSKKTTSTGDDDDVVETIIRRKRKVASRAAANQPFQRLEFEEVKEYSDTGTQYDPTYFSLSRTTQTDPEPKIIRASLSTQTDVSPALELGIQTEVEEKPEEPVKVTMEMEIQTDIVEEEAQQEDASRSPSPSSHQLDSLASSSSTVVPPTPKQLPHKTLGLDEEGSPGLVDQPPAYGDHDHSWAVVSDVLKKWHAGAKIPVPADGGVEGGEVSEELVEEWKGIKEELGVDCLVIDKIIANSKVTPSSSANDRTGQDPTPNGKGKRRSRFYNIYNTYVFGDSSSQGSGKSAPFQLATTLATQAAIVAGAGALVVLALTPYVAPHYSVPGGATYYDRAAWSSFNTMQATGEGFSTDGTAAVWSFLGRVGGGAARMARGWPT